MTEPNSPRQLDEEQDEKWYEKTPYQILLFVVGIALFGLILGLILDWYIDPRTSTAKKDLVQALGLITAGVAGAVGVYFTWRNLNQSRESTEKTLRLTAQGQITDRFTRAIDQLGATDDDGKPKLEIRIGGIYALERIAEDAPDPYRNIVAEALTAYVRYCAQWSTMEPSTSAVLTTGTEERSSAADPPEEPRFDIQAVLNILGKPFYTDLDLRRTNLQGAHLNNTDLPNARLFRSNLQGARLRNAELHSADLEEANLGGAALQGANLKGANLKGANLQGAALQGADLSHANLTGAKVTKDQLDAARSLRGAKLPEDLADH